MSVIGEARWGGGLFILKLPTSHLTTQAQGRRETGGPLSLFPNRSREKEKKEDWRTQLLVEACPPAKRGEECVCVFYT